MLISESKYRLLITLNMGVPSLLGTGAAAYICLSVSGKEASGSCRGWDPVLGRAYLMYDGRVGVTLPRL